MSFTLKIILGATFMCLFSCRSGNHERAQEADSIILKNINNAENTALSLNQRLSFALIADSQAISHDNEQLHIECSRLIATLYWKLGKADLAKTSFKKTIDLAMKKPDSVNLGIALNNVGLIFNEKGAYDSALYYYSFANRVFFLHKDSLRLAQGLINEGTALKSQGNFQEAFRKCLEAVKILELTKQSKDLAAAYTILGDVLRALSRFDEAMTYHIKALELRKQQNDSVGIAGSLNNLGNIFRNEQEDQKALSYYFQSLEIKKKLGHSKAMATSINNIAETYLELKEFNKAEPYFLQALDLRDSLGDRDGYLTTSNLLAKLYLQTNDIPKAEHIALQARKASPQTGFLKQRLDNSILLAEIYQKLRNYKLSLDYADDGLYLKDSLFNSTLAAEISRMQTQFETRQKEKELFESKQLGVIQANKISTQWYFITLSVVIMVLLSLLTILLFRSNKQKKKAKQRVETLLDELSHRVKNNQQIITDMLQMQLRIAKDEDQKSSIQGSIDRVQSINIIHKLLHKDGFNGSINMKDFIEALITNLKMVYADKSSAFEVFMKIQKLRLDINRAIPIGLIINELVTNLYKYAASTSEKPNVEIQLIEKNLVYKLQITDNLGHWNIDESLLLKKGLGLFLVETLVQQLDGIWETISTDSGTTHIIEFIKKKLAYGTS